jgi:hypothetical protein
MYDAGVEVISKIKGGLEMAKEYRHVNLWPSIFSGFQIIANRMTPPHRDPGGCPTHYDLLISAGTHTSCEMKLRELGLHLSYRPGTMVLLCGKVIMHEVEEWSGGERICVAHWMKDAIHSRLDMPRPAWLNRDGYLRTFCK